MLNIIKNIKNNVRLSMFASIAVFLLLMFICSIFLYNYSMRVKEDNENKVIVS